MGNDLLDGGFDGGSLLLKIGDTMLGSAGDDTYVVGSRFDDVIELDGEGHDTVRASLSYSLGTGTHLEDLVLTDDAASGSGNELDNRLTGNAAANTLTGLEGNDTLDGGRGADRLTGGVGDDTYYVDSVGDVVVERAGEGADRVVTSLSVYTLGANLEALEFNGSGSFVGVGNALANRITAGAGADTLNGGAGADTLVGLGGNDWYRVDNAGDNVVEAAAGGSDTIQATVSYALPENAEVLVLTGIGQTRGTGNVDANVIVGNAAANVLDGGGGADHLIGGEGNDTFIVDDVDDQVLELPGEGVDTVRSGLDYVLGTDIENLVLTGAGNFNGTGNALNNRLTGNGGSNRLDGGAGSDVMTGGAGSDFYVVDDARDTVEEASGALGGMDTVTTTLNTYVLTTNTEILRFAGVGGFSGVGNASNNEIYGGSMADRLDGRAGSDIMTGFDGDDVYIVDGAGDQIVELANGGTDTVLSSVSYLLIDNVENLSMSGSGVINGTGNGGPNVIFGNGAANVIDGGGGADRMAGGTGDDTYVVDQLGDQVTELFDEGSDTVRSAFDFTLGRYLENLVLTGSTDLEGIGNDVNNSLTGNGGNNRLDGGLGADAMFGGAGDDTYRVDNVQDVVSETAAGSSGIDTVETTLNAYALGANVERLVFLGVGSFSGIGNAQSNQITGGAFSDRLNGGGGADILVGREGDDTYVIDSVGDVVSENSGSGNDSVESSVSYSLTAFVENLTLTGVRAINGTGNDLTNVILGNQAANTLDGRAGTDRMSGGAGDDLYVVDDLGDSVVESALEGMDTVRSEIDYVLGENLEDLVLTGLGSIDGTGNDLNNDLSGNPGDNRLDGGLGDDAMFGGAGNDVYVVSSQFDVVNETAAGSSGIDSVETTLGFYTLGANVEELHFFGVGDFSGMGNALANTLVGGYGNDTLDGGRGADILIGLEGGDTYIVDDPGDQILFEETGGFGVDRLETSVTYVAPEEMELVILTGTRDIDVRMIPSFSYKSHYIFGNSGNNYLDGGSGPDMMRGNGGADTFVVDDPGDLVWTPDSDDTIIAFIDYALPSSTGKLVLAGLGAIGGTGNASDNILVGNVAGNVLDGLLGNDTMLGGAGDDTYRVDSALDVVNETATGSAGIDTVETTLLVYTLGANVENLVFSGSGAFMGKGNELDNSIRGGAGRDTLFGEGGRNALTGGLGDDTYVVGRSDSVFERADEGVDTIESSMTWNLSASPNVENLTLTGNATIDGSGNDLANTLRGNDRPNVLSGGLGNDTLFGFGGNDTLTGGGGADVFVFGPTPQSVTNRDTVTDFSSNDGDRLILDNDVFTNLGLTEAFLGAAQLRAGAGATTAADADDRIVFNTTTGGLYYDADGAGGVGAVQFAVLAGVTSLASTAVYVSD